MLEKDRNLMTLEVSPAERVYLWRKRRNLTQGEAAEMMGMPRRLWRAYETGAKANPSRRIQLLNKVMPWELMELWRRRHGWTVKEFAAKCGTTHVTLINRERGHGSWEEVYDWWEASVA